MEQQNQLQQPQNVDKENSTSPLSHTLAKPSDEGAKVLKEHNPSIVPGTDDASIVTVAGMRAFNKLEEKIQNKHERDNQSENKEKNNPSSSSSRTTQREQVSNENTRTSHRNPKESPQKDQERQPKMGASDISHDSELLLRTALRAFVNLEIKLKKRRLPSFDRFQELKEVKPPAPIPPNECCGKECLRCVWVRYSDQLSTYEAAQQLVDKSAYFVQK